MKIDTRASQASLEIEISTNRSNRTSLCLSDIVRNDLHGVEIGLNASGLGFRGHEISSYFRNLLHFNVSSCGYREEFYRIKNEMEKNQVDRKIASGIVRFDDFSLFFPLSILYRLAS